MQIGVTIPNNWGIEDPRQVVAFGPLAERLGYDSVWVMDHVLHVGYIRQRLGDRPYYHPLAVLSHLSATTSRVRLGTSVLVLPYHQPIALAKYVATLDQLSGGRVLLGVGAGGMAEEFAALGVPLRERGSLTDECIAVMQALWTSPEPRHEGRRWRFSDVVFSPRPVQRPRIPLWVGGASPAALRRAATVGDGWHPLGLTPEAFRAGREEVRRLAAAAGRDPDAITMSVRVDVDLPAAGEGPRARSRAGLPGDDLDALLAGVGAYRAAGAEHVVLAIASGDVPRITALMEAVAQRVIPQLR